MKSEWKIGQSCWFVCGTISGRDWDCGDSGPHATEEDASDAARNWLAGLTVGELARANCHTREHRIDSLDGSEVGSTSAIRNGVPVRI